MLDSDPGPYSGSGGALRNQIDDVHSARDPRLFPGGMSVDVRSTPHPRVC